MPGAVRTKAVAKSDFWRAVRLVGFSGVTASLSRTDPLAAVSCESLNITFSKASPL